MITRERRLRMREYLVDRLRPSYPDAEPVTLRGGGDTDGVNPTLIVCNSDTAVLLVDQVFPDGIFEVLHQEALRLKKNVGTFVIKDGDTFFRSAARDIHYKAEKELSLKGYDDPSEVNKIINLRPEEKYLQTVNSGKITYYQPVSDRLKEGIFTYVFEPVRYDYSHIDKKQRFGAAKKDSRKLFKWDHATEIQGPIVIGKREK